MYAFVKLQVLPFPPLDFRRFQIRQVFSMLCGEKSQSATPLENKSRRQKSLTEHDGCGADPQCITREA